MRKRRIQPDHAEEQKGEEQKGEETEAVLPDSRAGVSAEANPPQPARATRPAGRAAPPIPGRQPPFVEKGGKGLPNNKLRSQPGMTQRNSKSRRGR